MTPARRHVKRDLHETATPWTIIRSPTPATPRIPFVRSVYAEGHTAEEPLATSFPYCISTANTGALTP